MKTITVHELKSMIDNKEDFQLIDVREPYEIEICSIGANSIPLAEIPSRSDEISKDKKVVIHCRSGVRSGNAIGYLEQQFGFTNLYNLTGGILAWANEIDPEMETY
jgi:rhodanese-related sulfurtransferase